MAGTLKKARPSYDDVGEVGEAGLPGPSMDRFEEAAPHDVNETPAEDTTAYRATLAQLARELEAQARGPVDAPTIRRLHQRLAEWVEDLRSVGADERLAGAVEHELKRLSAALALGTSLASETLAVAEALGKLASAGAPPSRKRPFWK